MGGDILGFDYCFIDHLQYDEKAFNKRLIQATDACDLLTKFSAHLSRCESFDSQSVESSVSDFCQSEGIQLGQIIHALRVATTGKPAGFGMFDTLAVIGKQRVLSRIDATLALCHSRSAGH